MPYVSMRDVSEIKYFYLPYVYIFLRNSASPVSAPVPALAPGSGVPDLGTPAVEDPHVVPACIHAHAFREKSIIPSVPIRGKGIRNKNEEVRIYAHCFYNGILTAVYRFHPQGNRVRSAIGIRKGRIL